MGWPFALCFTVLVVGYCVCKYLDKRFPSGPEVVDDTDDDDDEDEEDDDEIVEEDEPRTS
jgi:hypothetical protein